MNPLVALIPAAGSALMIYYTYENLKYVNVCLPGIFHCELFNFIVPRRIRLTLAVGAAVVLALLAVLIVMGFYYVALAISILGLAVGVYGIYLQVSHNAYCMYCLTTDAILLITAVLIFLNV
ncbi:hypothetical protein [Vulcanisaeta thermophila]|uniref:hypothetical protein n=1 Tax=Vulcanisaeta thermophila TaxID=867917 RepID=UPI000853446E|nr:hypothetical protein [Vulcanisaeta thermophila]